MKFKPKIFIQIVRKYPINNVSTLMGIPTISTTSTSSVLPKCFIFTLVFRECFFQSNFYDHPFLLYWKLLASNALMTTETNLTSWSRKKCIKQTMMPIWETVQRFQSVKMLSNKSLLLLLIAATFSAAHLFTPFDLVDNYVDQFRSHVDRMGKLAEEYRVVPEEYDVLSQEDAKLLLGMYSSFFY